LAPHTSILPAQAKGLVQVGHPRCGIKEEKALNIGPGFASRFHSGLLGRNLPLGVLGESWDLINDQGTPGWDTWSTEAQGFFSNCPRSRPLGVGRTFWPLRPRLRTLPRATLSVDFAAILESPRCWFSARRAIRSGVLSLTVLGPRAPTRQHQKDAARSTPWAPRALALLRPGPRQTSGVAIARVASSTGLAPSPLLCSL